MSNDLTNGGNLLGNCIFCGFQIYSGSLHCCPTNISGTQTPVVRLPKKITPEVLKHAVETFKDDYFGMAQALNAIGERP